MSFSGTRRLVGLGFGAIQAGLFAYEAQRTGGYAPPLVVDVQAELVESVRADRGHVRVNIARADGVAIETIGPMRAADSTVPGEREAIVDAIADADELATALPSVAVYRSDASSSPHQLIAEGLRRRGSDTPLLVLCAENHRSAASILEEAVLDAVDPSARDQVRSRARYVDTVIGKMSGVISDPVEIAALGLATITSSSTSALLVEAFDRILVSRADPAGVLHPGMPVLREVDDLAPFEDAKLLGHNGTHALGAFLGQLLDLRLFADLTDVPGAMAFLRAGFIDESGATLIRRHGGVDPMFTPDGFAAYADDLLDRMVNPYLADTIARAARDPRRKLGWDDRLIGLIRMGIAEGVPVPRYAMGVAAGLDVLRGDGAAGDDAALLAAIWRGHPERREVDAVLATVAAGREWLQRWQRDGFDGLWRDG